MEVVFDFNSARRFGTARRLIKDCIKTIPSTVEETLSFGDEAELCSLLHDRFRYNPIGLTITVVLKGEDEIFVGVLPNLEKNYCYEKCYCIRFRTKFGAFLIGIPLSGAYIKNVCLN